jgi:long-chain acyl-CoA synthetase
MNYREECLQGETRLPSVERPWLKYYPSKYRKAETSKLTQYEYLYFTNHLYPDFTVLIYEDRKICNKDFFQEIEYFANGLAAYGLAVEQSISVCASNSPEVFALFFASNKIGVSVNFPDPRITDGDFQLMLKETDSRLLVVTESYFLSRGALHGTAHCPLLILPDIRSGNPLEASNNIEVPVDSNVISWVDFINVCFHAPSVDAAPYDADRTVLMEQTGGSTGKPKSVMLTDENINVLNDVSVKIFGMAYATHIRREEVKYLSLFQPYVTLGVCMPLLYFYMGIIVVLADEESDKHIPEKLVEWHPNLFFSAPIGYEAIMSSSLIRDMDLSFIFSFRTGGDIVTKSFEERINTFMNEHGAHGRLMIGYGLTETALGFTSQMEGMYHEGSCGVSLPQNVIGIFKPGTHDELTYNTEGEICISGPSVMKGYFNNKESSDAVIHVHGDGRRWYHTGDLGHMDEDGFVYISGRLKRMFKRFGAHVYPFHIDQVLQKSPLVDICKTVGKPDAAAGMVPVSFVTLKVEVADNNIVKESLMQLCRQELPDYCVPVEIIILQKFPLTRADKIDTIALNNLLK